MTRIVDSVLVDEDGADQSTELYQRVPVAAVAGETRSLDREDGADPTVTDCSQQPLEAWTGDAAGRPPKIVVDDFDGRPAKLPGAIGESVLPALALEVVHELIGGRLANIDASDALQMLSCDFAHECSPRLFVGPASLRSRGAELPRDSRARPCVPGTASRVASPRRTGSVDD